MKSIIVIAAYFLFVVSMSYGMNDFNKTSKELSKPSASQMTLREHEDSEDSEDLWHCDDGCPCSECEDSAFSVRPLYQSLSPQPKFAPPKSFRFKMFELLGCLILEAKEDKEKFPGLRYSYERLKKIRRQIKSYLLIEEAEGMKLFNKEFSIEEICEFNWSKVLKNKQEQNFLTERVKDLIFPTRIINLDDRIGSIWRFFFINKKEGNFKRILKRLRNEEGGEMDGL